MLGQWEKLVELFQLVHIDDTGTKMVQTETIGTSS